MIRAFIALALLTVSSCGAQDPIASGNSTMMKFSAASIPLAVVDQAGNVTINWKAVEGAATDPDLVGIYARLMLAIRDKTYKDITP